MGSRPELIFFESTPNEMDNRVPLASSLQSFESAMLLVGIRRYPHALVSCVFAIEGALKAGLSIDESDRGKLSERLRQAAVAKPGLTLFVRSGDLTTLTRRRDKIAHFGFTPRDDRECAQLLLKTGIPYLAACYREFFEFDLVGSINSELGNHLALALDVYQKVQKAITAPELCFSAVSAWVRESMKLSLASQWERITLDDARSQGMPDGLVREAVERYQYEGSKYRWRFNCPVCGTWESFVGDLDDALDNGDVSVVSGECFFCGFVASPEIRLLTEILLGDQPERARAQILKEWC